MLNIRNNVTADLKKKGEKKEKGKDYYPSKNKLRNVIYCLILFTFHFVIVCYVNKRTHI